jgi:ATP-binding cassette subfamily B protein
LTGTATNFSLLGGAVKFLGARLRGARLAGMLAAFGIMLAVGWLVNRPSLLLGALIDKVVEGDDRTFADILPFLVTIAAMIVAAEMLTVVRKFIVERISTNLEAAEFYSAIRHVASLDLAQLTNERMGALNVRIHRSIEGVSKLLKVGFLDFMPTLCIAVVGWVLAAQRNPYVAGIMLLVAVVGTVVTLVQVASQKGIRVDLFRAKEELSAGVSELLTGIEYVRATGAVTAETERSKRLAGRLRDREFLHHKWMMGFDGAKQLIEGLGWIGVIALSAWFASEGVISKGEVLTLAMLYVSVSRPLRDLHRTVDEGFEAALKIRDLTDIYFRAIDPGLSGKLAPITSVVEPIVCCRGLTVTHVRLDGSVHLALKDVDFEMLPGERIGIAGPSGSGKSTFLKVLLGLNSRYDGICNVFGVEVRELDKAALASRIAYVPQSPHLFKGNVKDNVAYDASSVPTDDCIWAALAQAQLSDRVKQLPNLLDSDVAEQGRNFSGGERQRLALSRLFLKRHELLCMDEPTAALDTISEDLVHEAIVRLIQEGSAIVIAHRLNTLRTMDRVVVFDEGRIVQAGTYDQLVARRGVFRTLVESEGDTDRRQYADDDLRQPT